MIRLILVEELAIFRQLLSHWLQATGRMEVVAQAASAKEALETTRAVDCDVVLMDLELPDGGGLRCIRELRRLGHPARVLVLSALADDDSVRAAVEAGAHGYITKQAGIEDLLYAIDQVYAGSVYIEPPLAHRLVKAPPRPPSPHRTLSGRELQVLKLAAQGLKAREIGDGMGLAANTVRAHLNALYKKFGVHDRTQLVLSAMDEGILPHRGGAHGGSAARLAPT